MVTTVTEVVTEAYYHSQIVSEDFETVSGKQLNVGVKQLNQILADKTIDHGMIPYMTNDTFVGVIGQEAYQISNLISIDTLVFYKDNVRYSMRMINRDQYFGSPRVENISTLPYTYHVERNFGGATIYLYFTPDESYNFEYWGKSRLTNVVLNQDLSLTLDQFYINYLIYALADRLCSVNSVEPPRLVVIQNARYIKMINKNSAVLDLTSKKVSTLSSRTSGINYGQVNLGNGWTVG